MGLLTQLCEADQLTAGVLKTQRGEDQTLTRSANDGLARPQTVQPGGGP